MKAQLDFSLRYGVVGAYKDRRPGPGVWRIYPVPFFRITFIRGHRTLPVPGTDEVVIVA